MEILLVEDNPGDAALIRYYLREVARRDLSVTHVARLDQGRQLLAEKSFDIVLLDMGLPDCQGLDGLRRLQEQASDVPIVLLTGNEDTSLDLQALGEGAQDYVTKDRADGELLMRTIRYSIGRKKAERELQRHAQELERVNMVLSNFLTTMSHELQTPITGILSSTEILLSYGDSDSPETRREFLDIIRNESERLSELIRQILDMAALEGGSMQMTMAELDLRDLVVECVRSKGITEMTTLELREAPAPYMGDPTQLRRVLMNLLDNAQTFSPKGGRITVSLRDVSGGHELRVADQGPGVPCDERKRRIFEKFVQRDDILTDKPPGAGLGLAIAKKIVTLHGGQIHCQDNSGGGAVFVVHLPVEVMSLR